MSSSSSTRSPILSSSWILLLVLVILSLTWMADASFNVTTIKFDEGYNPLFGDFNILRSSDGDSVRLLLNRYSGSGFISSSLYNHGLFSAKIKLPAAYTAGVVVAFYTSNADVFEKTHDELDIEFLGNIEGKEWRFQTNVYGNGSTSRGREERYYLWFDPTKDFHRYSILWTENIIIFYVDDVPIREIVKNEAMGGDFPAKPMALYATIWDASTWATSGGKYKVNYKYAPFVSEFSDFILNGCPVDPIEQVPNSGCSEKKSELENADYTTLTSQRRSAMSNFRQKYMYYSYCYDILRYPVPPPECVIVPEEKRRFKDTGRLKFSGGHGSHHRRSKRKSHGGTTITNAKLSGNQAEI